MPREKRRTACGQPPGNARSKHKIRNREKIANRNDHGLVAKLDVPKISKHKTYLEFAENTDKKKKLEYEVRSRNEH
jgi:hypothetical protein